MQFSIKLISRSVVHYINKSCSKIGLPMFDFELPSNFCSMKVLLGTYYKTACILSTSNIIFYSRKVIASCWYGSYKNKRGRCNLRKTVLFLVHKISHSTIFQTRTLN